MSNSRDRFLLALRSLRNSDWEKFERLCSAFLAVEFPQVRTTASPGGDRGRDAELFTYSGSPSVLFQFSVARDWETKIANTLKRIKIEFPSAQHVIFLFSQEIGAQGDKARAKALVDGIGIDIRDEFWFVERFSLDEGRRIAAEDQREPSSTCCSELVASSATPQVFQVRRRRPPWSTLRCRREMSSRRRVLTKSCFEALVKCSLRGTTAESRKGRGEVRAHIQRLLPQHSPNQLNPFIDGALKRLSKNAIKHWEKLDEFHLSFEEVRRTQERVTRVTLLNQAFADT